MSDLFFHPSRTGKKVENKNGLSGKEKSEKWNSPVTHYYICAVKAAAGRGNIFATVRLFFKNKQTLIIYFVYICF